MGRPTPVCLILGWENNKTMAITNAKNNFFTRLFGSPVERSKSKFAQQEEQFMQLFNNTPGTPAGASGAAPSGFVPEFLPNYVGSPTVPTEQKQPPITSNPVTSPEPVPNAIKGAEPTSRYKLYEMLQAEPTRDTASEDIIKRRAKMNAISKGLSGLAGLAGVGMGGDAPFVPDGVTPFNMEQIQMLDSDYRNRLQGWIDRSFQVDQANTGVVNREIDQQIDAENANNLENLRTENDAMLADQKAQYALQLLQSKNQEEQWKEMESLGINPQSKDAYAQYLNAQKRRFNSELGYTNSKTNWNNRTTGRGGTATDQDGNKYPMDTLTTGRNAMIADLEAQLKQFDPMDFRNQSQIKFLQDQISELKKYNPGKNPLIDSEIAKRGYAIEDEEYGRSRGGASGQSAQQPTREMIPYLPGTGLTVGQQSNTRKADPQRDSRISAGLQRIASGQASDEDFEAILQDIVDAGEAETLQDAANLVYQLINGDQ